MVDQVVPLQPMEKHTRQDIHTAACGGPQAGAGGCALREAAAHGEPTLEQGYPEGRGRPRAGAQIEREEGAAERSCYGLTAAPALLRGEEVDGSGMLE